MNEHTHWVVGIEMKGFRLELQVISRVNDYNLAIFHFFLGAGNNLPSYNYIVVLLQVNTVSKLSNPVLIISNDHHSPHFSFNHSSICHFSILSLFGCNLIDEVAQVVVLPLEDAEPFGCLVLEIFKV